MCNIEKLRNALHSLCSGNYGRRQVTLVVEIFCCEVERLLRHRESLLWHIQGEWDKEDELTDIALDFIAPLFARDDKGVFTELLKYFKTYFERSDKVFKDALFRLLNSVVQQEAIRIFQDRDRVGKIFYRSLRYILSKHKDWEKVETSRDEAVIRKRGMETGTATEDLIAWAFRSVSNQIISPTQNMEKVLRDLVDSQGLAVPVKGMLQYIRQQGEYDSTSLTERTVNEDLLYNMSINQIARETVKEIDQLILQRYEDSGKLNSSEREGFKTAISLLLTDIADGSIHRSYCDYLMDTIGVMRSKKEYKKNYRKQFEYVAKMAKSTFSANVKSDFSLH